MSLCGLIFGKFMKFLRLSWELEETSSRDWNTNDKNLDCVNIKLWKCEHLKYITVTMIDERYTVS